MLLYRLRSLNKLVFLFLLQLPCAQPASPPFSPADTSTAGPDSVPDYELLEIDGSSIFTLEEPHVGDTLSYIITIEWVNPKVPFFVLAPESLTFSGFKKLGVGTDHKKVSRLEDGKPVLKNRSEFSYRLKAITQGSGKATSARLPYYTALSQEKEYLVISSNLIDILPAKVPITKKWYVRVLFWILLIVLLILAIKYSMIWWKEKKKRGLAPKSDFGQEMKEIKSRLQTGESKSVLLQMEDLSKRFLQQELSNKTQHNINTLIQEYLKRNPESHKDEWISLQQDFELAKFGGGHKASHEIIESYRNLKTCLNLKEEQDYE
jgi:hypothetical protein